MNLAQPPRIDIETGNPVPPSQKRLHYGSAGIAGRAGYDRCLLHVVPRLLGALPRRRNCGIISPKEME